MRAKGVSGPAHVVGAGVAGFKSCGVHRRPGAFFDQAACLGPRENGGEQIVKRVFFSKRRSA